MSSPVRVANKRSIRIERNNKRVSRLQSFDVKTFPHLLHLKNGEVIPCQVLAYDETAVNFRSPFISAKNLDTKYVKGIEITRGKTHGRKENRNPITITGGEKHRIILEDGRILDALMQREEDGNVQITLENVQIIGTDKHDRQIIRDNMIVVSGGFAKNDAAALKHGVELLFDPLEIQAEKLDVKLERALTVPRFNRDNPPRHILGANNGDLLRGKLISFNGETFLFESNLKKVPIPINRVARIIDVSIKDLEKLAENTKIEEEFAKEQIPSLKADDETAPALSLTRFALIHNPILIFEPVDANGETLNGGSPIYGKISIPIKSIQYIHFGDKAKSFQSVYKEWVIRSAKEPDYGDDR